jgi:hypothetical protein
MLRICEGSFIAENPVRTEDAGTFWEKEKKLIHSFVVENVPNVFEGLDEIITTSILGGLEHGNNMWIQLP